MTLLNPTEERLAGCHRGRSCRQKVSKEWGESTWVERQKKVVVVVVGMKRAIMGHVLDRRELVHAC